MENNTRTQAKNTPPQAQWANPTPAGLVALAVACFCFFALFTGRVTRGAMPIMACYLIGGFVIQVIVGLLDIRANNIAGGNTFLYFSIYFMLVSGASMLIKYYGVNLDTRIDGYAWLSLMLVVIIFTPAFYKAPAILFILVIVLNIAVPCIVLNDFQVLPPNVSLVFSNIAGYALLICGVLGIYLAGAMVCNATYGKNILYNPKPFYREKNKTPDGNG